MEWRLFADLAERAGKRRVSVAVEAGATVEDALDALLEAHPALTDRVLDDDGDLVPSVSVLRDGDPVADLTVTLSADDELALLPPASGG